MKPYPAVVWAQTAIEAGIAVAHEASGGLDRISAIEIAATKRGYQMTGSEPEKWAPDTRETADHSMPYITARAMFDGDITNDSYAPDKLRDPRILAFMRKITVKEDPALTAMMGDLVPTRVTATLDDGRRITRQVDDVPGFAGRPMQRADVDRKFHSNVGSRFPAERTRSILACAVGARSRRRSARPLLGKFSLPANPRARQERSADTASAAAPPRRFRAAA